VSAGERQVAGISPWGAEDGGEIGVGGTMPAVVAMKAKDQAASQSQPEQPCRPGCVPTNYPLAAYRSTLDRGRVVYPGGRLSRVSHIAWPTMKCRNKVGISVTPVHAALSHFSRPSEVGQHPEKRVK